MEEVANRTVQYLFENLVDESGRPSSVLVRFFITYPYQDLEVDLQQHVDRFLGHPPEYPGLRCQTLLATAGVEPVWNDRRQSVLYKVLPLTQEIVDSIPMFAQVSETFGIVINQAVTPDPDFLIELEQRTFNVVHVPNVVGSRYVPDQDDFVIPYGIQSLLGFYGLLPSGNLFTVLIFSRAQIPRETTEYFKTLALNVKMAILPFDEVAVFPPSTEGIQEKTIPQRLTEFRSRAGSLTQLLSVQEQIVVEQSERIEQMLDELRTHAQQLVETNQALEGEIVENVRLRQQEAQAAVSQERNRLARDLHDSLTQSLYSQMLYAEAVARLLDSGQVDQAAVHLRQLRDTAQQALREMRLLIFELRPSALKSEGLAAALQARLEAVEGRTGLEAVVDIDKTLSLAPEVETGLYWIAQEALNNALKYAQASKVSVSLRREDGQVVLHIEDDGAGFDLAAVARKGGVGLHSMRERAEKMDGLFHLSSRPGGGTVIHVEVPDV